MLPMSMMPGVVAYQENKDKELLPPAEKIIGAAEARIAEREQRLAKIETAVMVPLTQRSKAALDVLANHAENMAAVDQVGAARPQLENVHQSVVDIKKIYEDTSRALELTQQQLAQRVQQNIQLRNKVQSLQEQVKKTKDSSGMAFLRECGSKIGTYAANPQHPRYGKYDQSGK